MRHSGNAAARVANPVYCSRRDRGGGYLGPEALRLDEHRQGHPAVTARAALGRRPHRHGTGQRRGAAVGAGEMGAHQLGARLRTPVRQPGTAGRVALDHDGAVARIVEQFRHRLVEAGYGAGREGDAPLVVCLEQQIRLNRDAQRRVAVIAEQLAVLVARQLVEVVEAPVGKKAAEGPAPLEGLCAFRDVGHRVAGEGRRLRGVGE